MMCEHSLWSLPPSQLSCEASNNTGGRNGGRNLPVSFFSRWIYGWLDGWIDGYKTKFSTFQAGAKLDLGLRAGQKLREMARRGEEEEEVKTKVSQIILLDIPQLFDFNKRWRHLLLIYFLRNI